MEYSSPEDQLIVQCCQLHIPPSQIVDIRELLSSRIDWEYVLKASDRHKVTPLVFQALRDNLVENVPDSVLKQLRDKVRFTVAWNLLLKAELLKVVREFNDSNIPVIPFKGPVLAELIYSTLALRDFKDLDILVHKEDRVISEQLLVKLGYEFTLDELDRRRIQKDTHHYVLYKSSNNVPIELHWRLAERFWRAGSDPRLFWDNASYTLYENVPLLYPTSEDYLLYLCNHGSRHAWARLGWLCDLAGLIQTTTDTLNWPYLLERAREFETERPLFLGLALIKKLWPNIPVPEEVVGLIGKNQSPKTVAIIGQTLTGHSNRLSYTDQFMVRYSLLEEDQSNRGFLKYVLSFPRIRFKPSSKDFEWLPLPKTFHFLYYILRPIRMTVQQAPRLVMIRMKVLVQFMKKDQTKM